MQLYATVTSERASKGQGGKFLFIKVQNEEKKTIAELQIQSGCYRFWTDGSLKTWNEGVKKTKGNKQKGDN